MENISTIYLSRHGQSQDQELNKIGGDSDLTENGKQYAKRLKIYFDENTDTNDKFDVLCSELKRSINTALEFDNDDKYKIEKFEILNEIDGGDFEGLTFDEVKKFYPKTFEFRNNNKYTHAYPNGESYSDLVLRLKPVFDKIDKIDKMNNTTKIIIIAHQAICRIIYAHIMNIKYEDCVNIEIKSHCLLKFRNENCGEKWLYEKIDL